MYPPVISLASQVELFVGTRRLGHVSMSNNEKSLFRVSNHPYNLWGALFRHLKCHICVSACSAIKFVNIHLTKYIMHSTVKCWLFIQEY